MGRPQIHANLLTQCARPRAHLSAPASTRLAEPTELAGRLSQTLYLSHGSTVEAFARICQEGQLLSRVAVNQKHPNQPLSLDLIDLQLGTEDSIFFYAAPFRYPKSVCGFLFAASPETERSDDGTASPFDSGGLVHNVDFPAKFASPADFLRQHEFPIPGHSHYLRLSMDNLLVQPKSYIEEEASTVRG